MSTKPNIFPTRPATRRIAHILEPRHAPVAETGGYDYTLDLMRTLLGHAGVSLEECFIGYLGDAQQLATDLATYQPHVVVLWEQHGALLRAFGTQRRSLDDWAGYVWRAEALTPGVKCIATYAPARLRQEFGLTGTVKFHLQKAVREAATDELVVPERHIEIAAPWHGFTAQDVVNGLGLLRAKKAKLAHDLEGGCGMGPSCLGFAWSAHDAFVVPIYDVDGCSIWCEEDEVLIMTAAAELLEDAEVPKIIQNALYELFVLAWTTGIVVRGLKDDTMLKHFELYCELEKSLEFQASIYTSQPYWKLEHRVVEGRYVPFKNGRRATTEEWLIYNGTDCCVTYEVNEVMDRMLKPQQRAHYEFNVSLLVPLVYMSLRGIRYDKEKAQERLEETQRTIYELQDEINREAATSESRVELRQFYEALGAVDGLRQDVVAGMEKASETANSACAVGRILPLLTSAFCAARRVEKREVEEVTWQLHRWSGKKWVKDGKRLKEVPFPGPGQLIYVGEGKAPEDEDCAFPQQYTHWLKRISKLVTRSIPVAVETLEDVRRFVLGSKLEDCKRACAILAKHSGSAGTGLSPAQRGELATLLSIHIKINATNAGGDSQWYLYEHCGLPKQFQKEGNKLTTKLASDDEAIIKAYLKSGKNDETRDKRALTFLKMRRLVTQTKTLCAESDHDGRIRCGYNLVGTDTHRLACYESPTGSGFNLQTVTKSHRDLFLADEGCWLGQRDLSGADNWTTAAYSKKLGDPTMFDDLKARLKPAQIMVLMRDKGAEVGRINRPDLKLLCKDITEEKDKRYFPMKKVVHGSSYQSGKKTVSDGILVDSFKLTGTPIFVSPAECEEIQEKLFFGRYPGMRSYQEFIERTIRETGMLVASNGFTRRFFGRKDDSATVRAGLAHLPQVYTTYATTLAISRLWSDRENRRENGSLRVEPLHTVHDSLVPQWLKEDTEFAKAKLTLWFDNPIHIADEVITIPASGTFGVSWGEQTETL